jgi:PAS domain S-box-containing protein
LVGAYLVFVAPYGRFGEHVLADLVGAFAFLLTCAVIIAFGESLRRAERRADDVAGRVMEGEREQQRTWEELRQSEARFRSLVAATAQAVWTMDARGFVLEDSPGWRAYAGRAPEERTAEAWLAAVHPDDREDAAAAWARGLAEQSKVEIECRVRQPGGGYLWVHTTAVPVLNGDGTVREWIGSSADVTERRQAEEIQARLSALVASSDDAIASKTLDGIVTSWNAAAERLFGWTAEEMIGQPITRLSPPDRQDDVKPILAAIRRGERVEHFETERVRKDGQRIQVALTVSPIRDAEGRIIGASKIARDVSDRKRAEAERERLLVETERARRDAEAASRDKDAFLATVSHELRTPLSPILAWARMLRIGGGLDQDKAARAVETIERCAKAQAQLVEDLLDVSRIVAGRLRLDVRPVDLVPVVQAAVDVVRPAAEAKGVRLQVVLDPNAGRVSGDPARLQQVVWNLLSNAVKFTPRDGRVHVVLERVNSHVEVAVSDTGQGIAPEFLPHVFERFQQADRSPSRPHGGLGLGLAIVRHIAELHGGTVHAESPGPGQGAVFTLKLPVIVLARTAGEGERRHPRATDEPAHDALASLDGVRVLVVDDDPDSNEVVRLLLAGQGAEVEVAASAAQALDILGRWRPDVLVSDIGMPGEDGYGLIRNVRAHDGDKPKRLPAVALTAYATIDDRVRLLSAGFQAHVTKPLDPAELVAVVASLGGVTDVA